MKHIAIYARVSTGRQDLANQQPDLQRWIDVHADGQPVRWYEDQASGKTMDRPGWQAVEAALLAREVSSIVVWRLDRLGRTAAGLCTLFSELEALKVNLVSVKDSLDLSTAAGRLMANVLASVAQYENEVRSERIQAGIARAKAQGKRWGGSQPGRRTPPEKLHTIEHLLKQHPEWSLRKIARTLSVSPTLVSQIKQRGRA